MHYRPYPPVLALVAATTATGHAVAASENTLEVESATQLDPIVVTGEPLDAVAESSRLQGERLEAARIGTSDTAKLLRKVPGISLYGAGGISSLPAIRGLADERVRITVDGMDLISACPNHMNPPLSYLDPSAVGSISVYAGIVPVSLAGDSIGGSIIAETAAPTFADAGAEPLLDGKIGSYYQSNGDRYRVDVAASAASDTLSLRYQGAQSKARNYKAAEDFKTTNTTGRLGHTLGLDVVGSTAYDVRNHALDLAWRNANQLVEVELGYQTVPEELFPNQRMDLLDNEQKRVNLAYTGDFDWGQLQANAYYEHVDHFMDFGPDKRFWYGPASGMMAVNGTPCAPISPTCAAGMPMRTKGKTLGAKVSADVDLNDTQRLRLGSEYQNYRLDDWWSPSGAAMYPGTFYNINDGRRDRFALYGEWEARPMPGWLTLIGARYERVDMDTGDVRGYNTSPRAPGNQAAEAEAFNSQDRRQRDDNLNLSALARYVIDDTKTVELGVAHLVRSPSLYERYAWSSWPMAASMNNSVGDGNGYVGDIDLKPERANTVALTFDWQSLDSEWSLRATPYFTAVSDYIDAVPFNDATWKPDQFNVLQYANQDARLYGIDVAAQAPLGQGNLGRFGLEGVLGYTKGENRDTGEGLYNIMPLNLSLTLTHRLGGWDNGIEVIMVDSKDDLSEVRNEIETPGYTLVNLRGSYTWSKLRIDVGIENVLNRMYYLPLGGAYLGQGRTMALNPTDGTLAWGTAVPGMGRSYYVGMSLYF